MSLYRAHISDAAVKMPTAVHDFTGSRLYYRRADICKAPVEREAGQDDLHTSPEYFLWRSRITFLLRIFGVVATRDTMYKRGSRCNKSANERVCDLSIMRCFEDFICTDVSYIDQSTHHRMKRQRTKSDTSC